MNIKLIIYGAIIGIANIIPGVSGGTMAVILGVYDKLIQCISNLRKDFVNSMKFLIPIGIGGGIGILLFAKIIEYSLENFGIATNLVFVGLIVGSIPMISNKVLKEKEEKGKLGVGTVIVCLICLAIMIYMGVTSPEESSTIMSTPTVVNCLKLFLGSVIAAGAMIIPGISGSFIMLLLGIYTSILAAVSDLNIIMLIPVALGCGVGVLLCAKIMDIMFVKYPHQTYSGILGLMIGSVFVIFPSYQLNLEFVVGIILAIGAGVVAYLFAKKQ